MTHDEFPDDFKRVMTQLRQIAAKHDLPPVSLLLHPAWKGIIARSPDYRDLYISGSQYMGVTVNYGMIAKQRTVLIHE